MRRIHWEEAFEIIQHEKPILVAPGALLWVHDGCGTCPSCRSGVRFDWQISDAGILQYQCPECTELFGLPFVIKEESKIAEKIYLSWELVYELLRVSSNPIARQNNYIITLFCPHCKTKNTFGKLRYYLDEYWRLFWGCPKCGYSHATQNVFSQDKYLKAILS